MTEDHTFCRALLAATMVEIRRLTTTEERKTAWAWGSDQRCKEFHGPNLADGGNHYWYGRACCLWEAQQKGWSHWLEQQTTISKRQTRFKEAIEQHFGW